MVDRNRAQKKSNDTPTKEVPGAFLTDEEIASYQALFKEEFGIELTKTQALDKGSRLVRLLRITLEATAEHNASINRSN